MLHGHNMTRTPPLTRKQQRQRVQHHAKAITLAISHSQSSSSSRSSAPSCQHMPPALSSCLLTAAKISNPVVRVRWQSALPQCCNAVPTAGALHTCQQAWHGINCHVQYTTLPDTHTVWHAAACGMALPVSSTHTMQQGCMHTHTHPLTLRHCCCRRRRRCCMTVPAVRQARRSCGGR